MNTERIRVSGIGLCRIRHPHKARYLLGLNRNRLSNGQHILMALGGSFHIHNPERIRAWDAQLETPNLMEMRFSVPSDKLASVRIWFQSRKERELDSYRELQEELVSEYNVLVSLARSDLTLTLVSQVERERLTGRHGATGQLTHYFLEVFDVRFSPHIEQTLLQLDNAPVDERMLYWVSEAEIAARHLRIVGNTGKNILVDADVILNP